MGTFRLQLFTAPGTRPVAVATQGPAEGGRLADWAEDYAAEVWRRHCPDSAEPPVWITLQLSPGGREGRRPQRFSLVTFRLWEPYELSWPQRFADHSALQPGPRFRLRAGYTNGRHRTTAMLDVGVRRTIIVRWRYPS